MSSLAEAINAEATFKRSAGCAVATILASLPKPKRADLDAALANKGVQHSAIKRGLEKDTGIKIAASTLGRHRTGECSCSRS